MIPSILALEVEYDMSPENYQKTVNLKLDINKQKLEDLNNSRKESNLEEITLESIQNLVIKGTVESKDNDFFYKMNPAKNEVELASLIEPLLEMNIDYFRKNQINFLYYAPDFGKLMESESYDKIIEDYYLNIRDRVIKNDLGDINYEKVTDPENKFNAVYKTLLHKPLKQVEDVFLPSLKNSEESKFYQDKNYITFLPETYLWSIPKNMKEESVKADKIKFTLRYLKMDEIDSSKSELLENEEYISNSGKVIFEEVFDLDKEKPFETDWSNDSLKQNNCIVETGVYPKFVEKDDGEIGVSAPQKTKEFLLRCYFGVHGKFFGIDNNIVQNE